MLEEIKNKIRDIPDFPKKGIIFKDITPILSNPSTFKTLIELLSQRYRDKGIEQVVGIETRGLVIGAALAYSLNTGLTLIRKPGKLPYRTHKIVYELEYGTDSLEIHADALKKGQRIIIVDDLLATGGTAKATAELVTKFEASIVEITFLIELLFLHGSKRLKDYPIFSLIKL